MKEFESIFCRCCFPRDPVEMIMLKSPDGDRGATETAVGKTTVYQGITDEELSAKWQETVDELGKRGVTVTNAKSALEGALSIRYTDQIDISICRPPFSPRSRAMANVRYGTAAVRCI